MNLGIKFSMSFSSTAGGFRPNTILKSKKLSNFEKDFFIQNYSTDVCSTQLFFRESTESARANQDIQFSFKYRLFSEKRRGFLFFLDQIIFRKKHGEEFEAEGVISNYTYQAWWDEWYEYSPRDIKKIVKANVGLEFNWFSGGWIFN